MSGRINSISPRDALSQCQALFQVRLASPSRRIQDIVEEVHEEVREENDHSPSKLVPFQFKLYIQRFILLSRWVHSTTPSNSISIDSPKLDVGDIVEVATVQNFMSLQVARLAHFEGVRIIAIYDRLDLPEPSDSEESQLLFIQSYRPEYHVFSMLGAAATRELSEFSFQKSP